MRFWFINIKTYVFVQTGFNMMTIRNWCEQEQSQN